MGLISSFKNSVVSAVNTATKAVASALISARSSDADAASNLSSRM